MTKKKAFMKTIEAVLAIIFMASLYTQIAGLVYGGAGDVERDPSIQVRQVLDMLDNNGLLKELLENHDARGVNALLARVIPPRYGFVARMNYITTINTTIKIKPDESWSPEGSDVAAFTYNFPTYVDTNSIRLHSSNTLYDANVVWNWMETPVKITSEQHEKGVASLKGIQIKDAKLEDSKSIVIFVDEKEMPTELKDYDVIGVIDEDRGVAEINFELPFLKRGEQKQALIYYNTLETLFKADTNVGSATIGIVSIVTEPRIETIRPTQSRRADVYVRVPDLVPGEEKTLVMEYSIGTEHKKSYDTNLNFENVDTKADGTPLISVDMRENRPKSGTVPIYGAGTKKNVYKVKKGLPLKDNMAEIDLSVWYKW